MEVTIYTTQGCGWCTRTKELLEKANITEYTEINWSDLSGDEQEQFRLDYPEANGFPVVFVDGVMYTGLVPLAKKFLADGLVTAPKKK